MYTEPKQKGYIVIAVLVFSGVFAVILFGLVGFIFVQNRAQVIRSNQAIARDVAEAGLDYYKWYLAHFPDDYQHGTGGPGPYIINYNDPEGGGIGKFSLDIQTVEECNEVTSVEITSTGWEKDNADITKTVFGRYAQPSVAEYAFIINSDVWAGSDRDINGKYHSNGGIRMDGTNQSIVSSAVEDWQCTSTFGCDPASTTPGIWGAGTGSALWEFPVSQIDFLNIAVDLAAMKTTAQSMGYYRSPSNRRGWHFVFLNDGTFDVYRVMQVNFAWSEHIDNPGVSVQDWHTIVTEQFIQNRPIPGNCSLIFVEDKLWIEGEISGKVTVAVATPDDPLDEIDVILEGNITYKDDDSVEDGLTIIAENSILIPLMSPDDMELSGVFIAQGGYFGRNLYSSTYSPNHLRNSLTTHGTIVSNERVGTKWSCGGSYCSGYNTRDNTFDRELSINPPPLTPFVSDEFTFVEWRDFEANE